MSSKPARQCLRVAFLLAIVALLAAATTGAATLEQQAVAHLDEIRAIKAGQSDAMRETYNQQMDAAWKFYTSHQPAILPVLRALLKAEFERVQPSDLVLLDVGFFLHENDGPEGKALARDALFRLNPAAPIVKENWMELFELAHDAAEARDPRVLDFIDRTFLPSDQKILIPQHALQLDGTLICVFLYGSYGADAESHLTTKLPDRALTKRILELLVWLGTPNSVRQVGDVLSASPNYETVSRVTAFMMQSAGLAGRDFMLNLDATKLDSQSREYLSKIDSAIQTMSFDKIRGSLASLPGDKKLADYEVTARINAMIANYGKDDRTSQLAILDSGLAANSLIASLLKVRSLSLHRLSDEALSDVEVTNSVVNALRYRGH